MEQYIDKAALVAEIKNFIERAEAERVLYPKTILAAKNYLLIEDYKKLLSKIDTLEAKEVKDSNDALIEKTCEYLGPILTEYAGFYVGGEILQRVKNYMKGE